MTEPRKFVRKTFFVHQYEKEEVFLSKMAKEGWHLVKLYKGITSKYEFVKGESVDYSYQLDYVTKDEDKEDYHQLFADAGWEEVFSQEGAYDGSGRWYYFRRVRVEEREDRIYTDTDSKYQMYAKLWKKFGFVFLLLFLLELNAFRSCAERLAQANMVSANGIGLILLCVFFIGAMLLLGYMTLGILREKAKIKRKIM